MPLETDHSDQSCRSCKKTAVVVMYAAEIWLLVHRYIDNIFGLLRALKYVYVLYCLKKTRLPFTITDRYQLLELDQTCVSVCQ